MNALPVVRRLGWISAALALALWAVSLWLGCAGRAALVGGISLLAGALLGTLLALITRTRRPVFIYILLLAALATFWPLFAAWPPASMEDVHPWRGAPSLAYNYFDALRVCLFILGIPYPFATLGYHAPDPPQNGGDGHNAQET